MKINEIFLQQMAEELVRLCKNEFNLENLPKIELLLNKNSIESSSFGMFDGEKIVVVAKDRHPLDTMRTLAHELVHWKQNENGAELDGTTGSFTENEANAIAGVVMRKFAKKYPEYFSENN